MTWMIYGATGYTGVLVAEEAKKRGHSPILAGRSETKLKPLAERLGMDYRAFGLDSFENVVKALRESQVELVLHLAGPYVVTGDVMIRACLEVGAHYLDITGELNVYQNAYRYHQQAEDKNIVILPGVGMDVVPSDCLLKYVADKLENPTHLEIAFYAEEIVFSRGTQKSGLESLRHVGNVIRHDGELVIVPFGKDRKKVRFLAGEFDAIQNVWGDVVTAYRTTGIPNIKTYFVLPKAIEQQFSFLNKVRPLLNIGFVRNFFKSQVDKQAEGPSPELRENGRIYYYAKASNAAGQVAEAWMETCEGYRLTRLATVQAVEQVLDGDFKGAMTPAAAFGADFILGIDGTKRVDSLD